MRYLYLPALTYAHGTKVLLTKDKYNYLDFVFEEQPLDYSLLTLQQFQNAVFKSILRGLQTKMIYAILICVDVFGIVDCCKCDLSVDAGFFLLTAKSIFFF